MCSQTPQRPLRLDDRLRCVSVRLFFSAAEPDRRMQTGVCFTTYRLYGLLDQSATFILKFSSDFVRNGAICLLLRHADGKKRNLFFSYKNKRCFLKKSCNIGCALLLNQNCLS